MAKNAVYINENINIPSQPADIRIIKAIEGMSTAYKRNDQKIINKLIPSTLIQDGRIFAQNLMQQK